MAATCLSGVSRSPRCQPWAGGQGCRRLTPSGSRRRDREGGSGVCAETEGSSEFPVGSQAGGDAQSPGRRLGVILGTGRVFSPVPCARRSRCPAQDLGLKTSSARPLSACPPRGFAHRRGSPSALAFRGLAPAGVRPFANPVTRPTCPGLQISTFSRLLTSHDCELLEAEVKGQALRPTLLSLQQFDTELSFLKGVRWGPPPSLRLPVLPGPDRTWVSLPRLQ